MSGRRSHDASAYYARRINEDNARTEGKPAAYAEKALPAHLANRVLLDSCVSPAKRNRLPPRSVHLMVTSPPYAVGKDYDEDLTLPEYRKLLRGAWKETRRVLVPGGRVCINVANIGRKPYIPLHAYIIQDMERLGFLMRGEIIWDKGSSAGSSTAWGSWEVGLQSHHQRPARVYPDLQQGGVTAAPRSTAAATPSAAMSSWITRAAYGR